MLEGHITETMHLIQGQSDQQRQRHPTAYLGYIQEYFPEDNTVTVINPSNINPDTLTPMVSQRMPLGVGMAGTANEENPLNADIERWGFQIAPFGGGSQDKPMNGEQVLVVIMNPEIGYGASAFLLNNDKAKPPGGENIRIIGGQLQNGEFLFVSPTGTLIYCDVLGNIKIITQKQPDQAQDATGNFTMVSNGGARIAAREEDTVPDDPLEGNVELDAVQDIAMTADNDITGDAQHDIKLTAGHDIQAEAVHNIDIAAGNNLSTQSVLNTIVTVGNDLSAIVAQSASLATGADLTETVGGASTETVVGNKTITAGAVVTITATGEIYINSDALIQLLAPAISAGAIGEVLSRLVREEFLVLYNAHTHSGVTAGLAHTGPPVVPAVPGMPLTTDVLEAG